jgi:hypothetical protein
LHRLRDSSDESETDNNAVRADERTVEGMNEGTIAPGDDDASQHSENDGEVSETEVANEGGEDDSEKGETDVSGEGDGDDSMKGDADREGETAHAQQDRTRAASGEVHSASTKAAYKTLVETRKTLTEAAQKTLTEAAQETLTEAAQQTLTEAAQQTLQNDHLKMNTGKPVPPTEMVAEQRAHTTAANATKQDRHPRLKQAASESNDSSSQESDTEEDQRKRTLKRKQRDRSSSVPVVSAPIKEKLRIMIVNGMYLMISLFCIQYVSPVCLNDVSSVCLNDVSPVCLNDVSPVCLNDVSPVCLNDVSPVFAFVVCIPCLPVRCM